MYLQRALKAHLDGTLAAVGGKTLQRAASRGGVSWRLRKRARGSQGRPAKATLVKELLYAWFCDIKRSVCSRIPPKLVLTKARLLMEEFIRAHLDAFVAAEAAVVDYKWLSNWKREYGISLRKPNRKWSYPRATLKERLRIMWSNVMRVRKLMLLEFGREPIMDNFDQSPFHMNEVGSRKAPTLSIRGSGAVVLKEGHAATRERWSANTMVTSCPDRARAIPPLEIMFRAARGGARMVGRLREAVPAWATWMTIVTSSSGSYQEADVLNYLEQVLEPMHSGRDWRILFVDGYRAQTTSAVRRLAWHRGYVLIVHGGGTTGITQVNDTDLHQPLKVVYLNLETGELLEQQRLRPASCPVPRKEDCINWMAGAWGQPEMHTAAAGGFKKTG